MSQNDETYLLQLTVTEANLIRDALVVLNPDGSLESDRRDDLLDKLDELLGF